MLELILPILKRRIMLAPQTRRKLTVPDARDKALRRDWQKWHLELKQYSLPDDGVPNDFYWGALATTNIYNEARAYGLPQTLIRTLEFVYHNFTTLLANPLAFDSVLDLYDVFASFHRVLTRELPRVFKESDEKPLDKDRVELIARLIDAVHRSLGHRLYRLFPENSNRDMDIDFRGGLNALVYCADGILKLGVGVLRHHLLKEAVHDRARVGVVTRIGFRQGIYAIALRLQVESKARLGIVDTDVPHLYHLPSYVDFLHEAFHMVYDAARDPYPQDGVRAMLPTLERECNIDKRLAEVFANTLTALFVCHDEPMLLAEHMVIQFAIRNIHESDHETLGNLIELSCELYIVCYSINHLKVMAKEEKRAPWWHCQNDKPDDNDPTPNGEYDLMQKLKHRLDDKKALDAMTEENFIKFFFNLLPFYSTRNVGWCERDPKYKEVLEGQARIVFQEVYQEQLRQFAPVVVIKACLIYSRYWFRASGRLLNDKLYKNIVMQNLSNDKPVTQAKLNELLKAWEEIQQELKEEMNPIMGENGVKRAYRPFSLLTWRSTNKRGRLDPMIVLGFLLNKILSSRSSDMRGPNKAGPHHLPTKAGSPCFDSDVHEVHKDPNQRPRVFIQRGVSALFSSDLDYRAHRLGSRITMLKMFGDMAARLRSKRFSEMLNRNVSAKLPRLLTVLQKEANDEYVKLVKHFDKGGDASLPPEKWYESCKARKIFSPPMPTQKNLPPETLLYYELADWVNNTLHELSAADARCQVRISSALFESTEP